LVSVRRGAERESVGERAIGRVLDPFQVCAERKLAPAEFAARHSKALRLERTMPLGLSSRAARNEQRRAHVATLPVKPLDRFGQVPAQSGPRKATEGHEAIFF